MEYIKTHGVYVHSQLTVLPNLFARTRLSHCQCQKAVHDAKAGRSFTGSASAHFDDALNRALGNLLPTIHHLGVDARAVDNLACVRLQWDRRFRSLHDVRRSKDEFRGESV